MDPARWVLPPSTVSAPVARLLAVGDDHALVEAAGHPYLVSGKTGMRGALAPPASATWFGLGGGDVAFAASPGGHLHRATAITGRADASFEEVTHLPEAVAWDVAGARIVAGGGEKIWRSSDAGQTFEPMVVAPGFDVRQVLVRPDGVVVVAGYNGQGGRAVRVLKDDVWRHAQHALSDLVRWGGHITGRSVRGCKATLANDGRTWVGEVVPSRGGFDRSRPARAALSARAWTDLARPGSSARVVDAPEWNASTPPPTTDGRPGPNDCDADGSYGLLGNLFGAGGIFRGQDCVGVTCMRRMPDQARTDVVPGFFVRPCVSRDLRDCEKDPVAASIEHRRGRGWLRVEPPEACMPVSFEDIGGAGWLVCADGRTHAVAGDGKVYPEDRVPWRPTDIRQVVTSADGTVVADCGARGPCAGKFLVRRPVALGTRGAWREVEAKGAVAVAPLTEGRVVVVTSPGDPAVMAPIGLQGLSALGGGGIGVGNLGRLDPPPLSPLGRERLEAMRKQRAAQEAKAAREKAEREKRKAAERSKLQILSLTVHHADGREEVLARDLKVPFEVRRLEVEGAEPLLVVRDKGAEAYRRIAGGNLVAATQAPKPGPAAEERPGWGSIGPRATALDATHLYWIEGDQVMRLARSGGMPEVFVEEVERASALATDERNLYVARHAGEKRDGEVLRIRKSDGHRERGFTDLVRPVALQIAGGALFVADDGYEGADDGVVHVRSPSGEARVLIQGLGTIRDLAIDGERVLVAAGRTVLSVPRAGNAPATLIGSGRRPQALTSFDGEVWWADSEADRLWSTTSPQSGRFMRVRSMARRGRELLVASGGRLRVRRDGRWSVVAGADASVVVADENGAFLLASSWERATRIYRLDGDEPAPIYEAKSED